MGGGDRVKGGLGVDRQAGQAGVPALAHQHREPDACFGEVGEPGVAELVQGPAAAGRGEYLGGSPVGQPDPAGGGVEVGQSWLAGGCGGDVGEEQRAGAPAVQVSGQQPGGLGLPADDLGPAALADYHGAPGSQVQIGDVEGEDLAGAGGGLIQQPPQGLLPQRVVGVEEDDERAATAGGGATVGSGRSPAYQNQPSPSRQSGRQ